MLAEYSHVMARHSAAVMFDIQKAYENVTHMHLVQQAIKHLEDLLNIANEEKNKPAQADAFLKLGLLYY